MKLKSMSIRNFRAFDSVQIEFDRYTCFVGPNGAGKSTVLAALNTFFSEGTSGGSLDSLTEEDFHRRNVGDPVEITLFFTDLSDPAQQEFSDYYRDGVLVVSAKAEFDPVARAAPIKQYGKRLGMAAFAAFFEAQSDRKKVAEQVVLYEAIRQQIAGIPAAKTAAAMAEQLRKFEAEHPEQCVLLDSADEFYGFAGGAKLDRYVQWVYVPAVKDAASEQNETKNTALGKILARTARRAATFEQGVAELRERASADYRRLVAENQGSLERLSASLTARMAEWAHPEARIRIEWHQDESKAIRVEPPIGRVLGGEGAFESDVSRFGHGFQRSYLIALLQELADRDDAQAPLLILGCEEPELYQHPPQARHLLSVFERLSAANAQVLVSTHSPYFVSGEYFESVRMVRRPREIHPATVVSTKFEAIAAEIARVTGEPLRRSEGLTSQVHQCLRPTVNEMFFATHLVLVEGYEDIAYLTSYMTCLAITDTFRRIGGHIVPANGKSQLLVMSTVARQLGIATFVIADLDGHETNPRHRPMHERDNRALLSLFGRAEAGPFSADTLSGRGYTLWSSCLEKAVAAEFGDECWSAAQEAADRALGHCGDMKKHSLHIGVKLAHAWDQRGRSQSLESVCRAIADPASYL